MAENELLDLRGNGWRRTRAALADPRSPLLAIAACVSDDLNRGLRIRLSEAFRNGSTLVSILQAARGDKASLRATVASFQDQGLARIIRDVCTAEGTTDKNRIAQCAVEMLIDGVMQKTLLFAARNESLQDTVRRDALANTLRSELEARRSELTTVVLSSLEGERVQRVRRARSSSIMEPREARTLVNTSLVVHLQGGPNGKRPS